MRKIYIILLLVTTYSFSQEYKKIDAILGLDDTLKNSSEIRIYKSVDKTNYRSVFILFQDNTDKKWKVNFFELNLGQPNKTSKVSLHESKNIELLWLQILVSNILYISEDYLDFKYKLEKKTIINNGNDYLIQINKEIITHGNSYEVRFKKNDINKTYYYSNPEGYLENFPDVDELKIFMDFIKIIENFLERKL